MLRHRSLLGPEILEPYLKLVTVLNDCLQLLWSNVAIPFARLLRSIAVIADSTLQGCYPFLSHLVLLSSPCNDVSLGLQFVKLLNILDFGGLEIVIQPILSLHELRGKDVAIRARDVRSVCTALCNLISHGQDVALQVVSLLVGLNDLSHVSLHSSLLVGLLLQRLALKPRHTRGNKRNISALCATLLLHNIHPFVLLFWLLLGLLFLFLLSFLTLLLLFHWLIAFLWCLSCRFFWRQLTLLLHGLLVFLLFHKLSTLERKGTMQSELGLHFDLLGSCLRRELYLPTTKVLADACFQEGWLRVLSLDFEWTFSVKGQHLQQVHG
mmetsp:Transcript_51077/g.119562  ORF Transcript_51077/g.119562 Transcript_51077/m.119562 type:complete len:324 (+) Transcript_51077:310-1281(+)